MTLAERVLGINRLHPAWRETFDAVKSGSDVGGWFQSDVLARAASVQAYDSFARARWEWPRSRARDRRSPDRTRPGLFLGSPSPGAAPCFSRRSCRSSSFSAVVRPSVRGSFPVSLRDPVADRLRRRLVLLGRATCVYQLDHLLPNSGGYRGLGLDMWTPSSVEMGCPLNGVSSSYVNGVDLQCVSSHTLAGCEGPPREALMIHPHV